MIQTTEKIAIGNFFTNYFKYEPLPLNGVGKNKHPIIAMDKFVNLEKNLDLHLECCKGLAQAESFKMAMFPGAVHDSESIMGKVSFSEILFNLENYDKTGVHRENIIWLSENSDNPRKAIYTYIYFALGANIPWFFAYYLKIGKPPALQEHNMDAIPEAVYTDEAKKLFPNLINYIENLPFKNVDRVLFFATYPNAGVTTHRDMFVKPHKDHNINLFFAGGWRPTFVWDDIKHEKIYLQEGATSYFFNNRDYHGVDPEPNFRYTLRVDGVFEDWLQDELELDNGFV